MLWRLRRHRAYCSTLSVNCIAKTGRQTSLKHTPLNRHRLLAAGEIDVGLLHHPFDMRGLSASAPLAQSIGVLTNNEHSLASCKMLRCSSLSQSAIVRPSAVHARPFAALPRAWSTTRYWSSADGGMCPLKLLHGVKMTAAALLMTEQAVTFAAALKRDEKAD